MNSIIFNLRYKGLSCKRNFKICFYKVEMKYREGFGWRMRKERERKVDREG